MTFPKNEKKKLWQTNCGNAIAEIGGKNCVKLIVAMTLPKYEKKIKINKKLWQTNCGNAIAEMGVKEKLWQTNCGNGIAKIGKKKLWQWHYRNRGEKKIVTN